MTSGFGLRGFWIRTGAAFVVRSGRTTLALGLLIALAVGALVFVTAVATGVNDCMIRNATGLYTGQILGPALPGSLSPKDLEIPGVRAVLQRCAVSGTLEKPAGPSLPLVLTALEPGAERQTAALWKKVKAGRFLENRSGEILISRSIAGALDAEVGQELRFTGSGTAQAFRVAGIFETEIPQLDQGLAFCAQAALKMPPAIWQAAVFLEPGRAPEQIRAAWASGGLDPGLFTTWQEAMPDLTQLIDLNRISMAFVMVLVLGVVAFATACAFAIFIISRIREYGIMKTMGISPMETALLIFSQVLMLFLAASALGVALGASGVAGMARIGIDLSSFTSHNPYFVVSGVIYPRLTPFSLVLPPGLGLLFCLGAAVWPVLIVVRQRPGQILRSL